MTKTAKCCAIFFISTLWLVIMRIVFSLVDLSDNVSNWLFAVLVQVIGMGVIPLVLYKFWVKEDIVTGFSLKVKLPPVIYGLAVVIGLLLSYVTTGVSIIWQNILILLGFTHVNGVGTIYSDAGVLVAELCFTALLPAIFEELTDRGLLLRSLKEIKNERTVVVVAALMFGLCHQNAMQTGYAFIGGLVFAYLAVKTGSIVPGMIIHFLNNAVSVLGDWASQNGGFLSVVDEAINGFISEHFFLAILTWVLCGFFIVMLLRYVGGLVKQKQQILPPENSVYYFPNDSRSVDELFGSGFRRELTEKTTVAWYEYAFLYGAAALAFATTLFTYVWGVLR